MDAAFAARLELEMLDRVGDVDRLAIDAGVFQRLVQEMSRRPDERLAREIFLIARLLTDEHEFGARRSLAEYGLGRVSVEGTGRAVRCGFAQFLQGFPSHAFF